MPYLPILMIVACAIFFHRAAEFENESSLVWTGLSVVISVVTLFFLHWSWLGCLLGQIGLFAGITVLRMLRKS
jgi:hypothetical protein